jgi:hypothetical protein
MLTGMASRFDQPPPGVHSYRIELQHMIDIYREGVVTSFSASYAAGGTTVRDVFGLGTRWTSNLMQEDTFQFLNTATGPGPVVYVYDVVHDTHMRIYNDPYWGSPGSNDPDPGGTNDGTYRTARTPYSEVVRVLNAGPTGEQWSIIGGPTQLTLDISQAVMGVSEFRA